ncbi:MAG: type I DNA topoisomerase [Candidatus Ancillula sp.]|nr:type I DNA topoisomerase [Candidatus Ancillula sp.]
MGKKLVIVESPAKAKKIGSFLGSDFVVRASVGHVRDIPVPSKLPAKVKEQGGGAFKRFAVNIEAGFEPYYAVYSDKKKVISELKSLLKDADELLLATDEDREGEAIAWHLHEVLAPKVPVKRMVFHEITRDAITKSLEQTRDINLDLVDAQETRRIQDRLFGFQVSPYLWRKFGTGLSAGRVQSVTTRIVVHREIERIAFVESDYWDISANFSTLEDPNSFPAKLTYYNGSPIAVSKDFTNKGTLTTSAQKNGVLIVDESTSNDIVKFCQNVDFNVAEVLKKPYTRSPKAPFTTSSLQQEGVNRLKMSSASVMRTAQYLYENGYITYMRTDSPTLSQEALDAARDSAASLYGKDSVLPNAKIYRAVNSDAQEAHEAIRPAVPFVQPNKLANVLDPSQLKLYELIYKRTLASQMVPATGWTTTVKVADSQQIAVFSASGTIIENKGFLAALDDNYESSESAVTKDVRLPSLDNGQKLNVDSMTPLAHKTKPPARYTEASLVRKMEELGIGRPSTYASTIQTIQDRGYITKRGQALVPTWLAFGVNRVLEETLSKYVDYDFTAHMEKDLDEIALGKNERTKWLKNYWFGDGKVAQGLEKDTNILKEVVASKLSDDVFPVGSNKQYQVRITPYGAFVEDLLGKLDEQGRFPRGYIPEELAPDELTEDIAKEQIKIGVGTQNSGRTLGINPATGYTIVALSGRYGPYFTEILPDDVPKTGRNKVKAKTASLLSYMELDSVTLDDALKAFEIPRELGINPPDNEKITVNNGHFGPYLMKKDLNTKKYDYRSIKKTETETAQERMYTITLEEAIEVYSHEKVYRRRRKK